MDTDMDKAPLYEMLRRHSRRRRIRFHVPGHKGGRGRYRDIATVFGKALPALDLTELPELDDLNWPAPGGAVEEAQALAARAFGASRAWLLVGGSTAGVLAMVLAAVGPAQTLLATLPFHRSAAAAAVLAGCRLVALPPRLPETEVIPVPQDAETVGRAAAEVRPAALLVTSPTYEGVVADLPGLAAVAARLGIPLLVDAAHGAHLGAAPGLPPSPGAAGVSAWVVSLHKTAGALTPGAVLLAGSSGAQGAGGPAPLDPERIASALRLIQTSSPPFFLLASLDLARRRLALTGEADWSAVVRLCRWIAAEVPVLTGGRLACPGAVLGLERDPTRLVFTLTSGAPDELTGLELARRVARAGVDLETAGWGHVVAVASPADDRRTLRLLGTRLGRALEDCLAKTVLEAGGRENGRRLEKECWGMVPAYEMTPAEAFRRPRRRVPVSLAAGRVAADVVCPYPPGVPLVIPGQRITDAVVGYLSFLGRSGYRTHGLREGTESGPESTAGAPAGPPETIEVVR